MVTGGHRWSHLSLVRSRTSGMMALVVIMAQWPLIRNLSEERESKKCITYWHAGFTAVIKRFGAPPQWDGRSIRQIFGFIHITERASAPPPPRWQSEHEHLSAAAVQILLPFQPKSGAVSYSAYWVAIFEVVLFIWQWLWMERIHSIILPAKEEGGNSN